MDISGMGDIGYGNESILAGDYAFPIKNLSDPLRLRNAGRMRADP